MTRDDFRLELIKLTYTHGREPAEVVGRAKALEAYVLEAQEEMKAESSDASKRGSKGIRKNVGNSGSLG